MKTSSMNRLGDIRINGLILTKNIISNVLNYVYLILYSLTNFTYFNKIKKIVLLGIRQIGKAVDSESIIYRFEPCIPNQ